MKDTLQVKIYIYISVSPVSQSSLCGFCGDCMYRDKRNVLKNILTTEETWVCASYSKTKLHLPQGKFPSLTRMWGGGPCSKTKIMLIIYFSFFFL
jgi:hypothetical protein